MEDYFTVKNNPIRARYWNLERNIYYNTFPTRKRHFLRSVSQADLTTVVEVVDSVSDHIVCLGVCLAANNGHLDVVRFLISKREDYTILPARACVYAARAGHITVVKYLHQIAPQAVGSVANFSMTEAAYNGYLEVVIFFHEIGADVAYRDYAAITWAINNYHHHITQYLMPNCMFIADRIMSLAVKNGDLEFVQYLHSMGLNLNAKMGQYTAFETAAVCGYVDIVQYLHQNNCQIDFQNTTLLKSVAEKGHVKVFCYLVAIGFRAPDHKSPNCYTLGPKIYRYLENRLMMKLGLRHMAAKTYWQTHLFLPEMDRYPDEVIDILKIYNSPLTCIIA